MATSPSSYIEVPPGSRGFEFPAQTTNLVLIALPVFDVIIFESSTQVQFNGGIFDILK